MSFIEIRNIKKEFDRQIALNNISAEFGKGELVCILGPSGCGKTTLLRIIAGLETANSGQVYIKGKDVTTLPPSARNFGIVFQSYALFPNMTVMGNVLFGLRQKKWLTKDEMENKANEALRLVDLFEHKNKYPRQLSGGMQQRTALARAISLSPAFLLLDEPLSALDAKVRQKLRYEIRAIQRNLGITTIMVTHDQEEAMTMSDMIAVMNEGEILQIGAPIDIYNEPKNTFVADFIGESNILSGVMLGDYLVAFVDTEFKCVDKGFITGEAVEVVIRPEDVKLVSAQAGMITGQVKVVIFKGAHYEMLIETPLHVWKAHSTVMAEKGAQVGIVIEPDLIHVMKVDRTHALKPQNIDPGVEEE